ncbi:MAG: hypothetical protein WC390_11310 [Sulfurimonas sp.]|jgi:hypothetical protein
MLSWEEVQRKKRGDIKIVSVPEWGGDVGIKKFSARDMMFLRSLAKEEDADTVDDTARHVTEEDLQAIAEVLARGVCNDDGSPYCTTQEWSDFAADQMPVLNYLIEEVQSHNGMRQQQREELTKNSESGPTSAST